LNLFFLGVVVCCFSVKCFLDLGSKWLTQMTVKWWEALTSSAIFVLRSVANAVAVSLR